MGNKVKLFGIIALVTIIGLLIFACDNGSTGSGDPRPESPESMTTKSALQYFYDENVKAGWNLGNTLDAVNVPSAASETAWGNPAATQALINGVKAQGFDIVRIGCTWIGHVGGAPNYTISEARLARVAEVVNMVHNAGMKAIINIHHDGNYTQPPNTWGFLKFAEVGRGQANETQVKAQLAAMWTQIANYFKNYGDYLIFETMNEVHSGDWGSGSSNADINRLFDWNQTALNAIRATGGNNATRFVAVPGLGSTEPGTVITAHNQGKLLPNDGTNGTNKLIVSVHFYAPWQYTVADVTGQGGEGRNTITTAELNNIDTEAGHIKSTFIDNGIAVYYGEWGAPTNVRSSMSATIKSTHTDYIGRVAKAARANGIIPIIWDDGGDFKMLERSNGVPKTGLWKDVRDAYINAINTTTPPVITPPVVTPPADLDWGSGSIAGTWTWQEPYGDDANDGTSSIAVFEIEGKRTYSGNITNTYQYGFAGWTVTPDASTLPYLKAASSISFMVSGADKMYRLQIKTTNVTDYSEYQARFDTTTSGTGKLVTIPMSSFVSPGWGQSNSAAFNKNLAIELNFQATVAESGTGVFSLTIWDLKLNE
uniref:Glycoside hydrolase family 5 n=1 Tax=uncultured bacterium contig00024 TaxID=1181513 RepID=A0A806JYP1_9BACT|nr:glycoside hydrolase family 5 [uncultured bacterium contig00024]